MRGCVEFTFELHTDPCHARARVRPCTHARMHVQAKERYGARVIEVQCTASVRCCVCAHDAARHHMTRHVTAQHSIALRHPARQPAWQPARHHTSPHSTAWHHASPHGTAQHRMAQHGAACMARHGLARHHTARHGTARHRTAQHLTPHHGAAQCHAPPHRHSR